MPSILPSAAPAQAVAHQRVLGRARVALDLRAGATRLARLAQTGAAKAMLPRVHGADPEIVFLNTAGGLTGGDRLDYALTLGAGARATATTQTAERAYRSLPGAPPARLDVTATVGPGGALTWVPQETILFDGAALERRTRIDLAGDARCLSCETVVLGRAAMGETVRDLAFRDWREIRRDGVPVLLDPLALAGEDLARLRNPAALGTARAIGSVSLVGADAEDRLEPLRGLLDTADGGVHVAASAWDGKLLVRALAPDLYPLRRLLAEILVQLGAAGLPRVWQM